MPSPDWSATRKRQYQHIKDSVLARGESLPVAEEIAARTVNKERSQHGESMEASAASVDDIPAGRRGGLRSHTRAAGRTVAQLRNEASQRGIKGRPLKHMELVSLLKVKHKLGHAHANASVAHFLAQKRGLRCKP